MKPVGTVQKVSARSFRAVSVVLVAVLAVSGIALVVRSNDQRRPGSEAPTGWVVVDGWSWAMLGNRALEVRVDDDPVDVTFRPVDRGDLEQMLQKSPDAVAQLVARVVTADPSLSCDSKGCSTTSGPVDLDEIVTPSHEVLVANGVRHGAMVARAGTERSLSLEVRWRGERRSGAKLRLRPTGPQRPESAVSTVVPGLGEVLNIPPQSDTTPRQMDSSELEREASRMGIPITSEGDVTQPGTDGLGPEIPVELPDPSGPGGPGPSSPPVEEGPEPTEGAPPTVQPSEGVDSEASKRGTPVLVAGVAWGRVFPLETPWWSFSDLPNPWSFGEGRSGLQPAEGDGSVPDAPFRRGLSVHDTSADELTPSQLTVWSSPLIGCGLGAVCAPTAKGVKAEDLMPASEASLCQVTEAPSGLEGVEPPSVPVKVVFRHQLLRFEGGPRVQLGAWPEDTPVPPSSFWPVPAPVQQGSFTVTVRSAEIYDGKGLWGVVGSQRLGEDPSPWGTEELLASPGGALLRRCG